MPPGIDRCPLRAKLSSVENHSCIPMNETAPPLKELAEEGALRPSWGSQVSLIRPPSRSSLCDVAVGWPLISCSTHRSPSGQWLQLVVLVFTHAAPSPPLPSRVGSTRWAPCLAHHIMAPALLMVSVWHARCTQ